MDFEVRHVDGTTVKLISSEHKCAITSATQTRKLCGNDTVTINLQSATYIEFQVGDKITIFGTTYTLNQLPTVKKESERSYTYTLVFEGLQYTLIDRVFLMPDNTQGDNLMFDLAGMLDVLDDNINRGNSGKQYEFVLDESLEETEYKNLSLTGKNCLQVLQQLCQEWDTEFVFAEEPTRIAIYIGVAGSTFAFPFTYGRGGGVYELNREKGASDICTRLFVYGGTQNLTYYRHNRLCLPSKEKNQSYVEDATAQAVYGIKEQVKNFDDIYPNRIGTITSLSGCDYNEFIDSAMADAEFGFDLNEKWANNADDCEEWLALKGLEDTPENEAIYYNDVADTATKYLMAGATAKIHFNTGALAGYECDLHSYTHSSQKFVLKPLVDENGYDFPSKTNAAFKLAVGDEYVILDINLPTAYKEEAESKLATEAASYFATVCRPQPKYTLTIEPIALKHIVGPSTADTEIFKVGDLINISDPTGGVESATIRIDQFVRNLLDPFDYKLTLTDEITYSQQVRTLIEVDAIKRVVEESKIYDVNRIRRGWKDAEELYNQMFDTEGHYYSEKIAPLSIDTQMLKVGARSQQLVLQNVLFQPNYNANPANLQISAGSLVHYTIAEPDIKTWTMSALSASNVPSTAQYVYAKCAKNGTTGTWLVTDQAIIFDSDSSYYHFLVGSLSSVDSVSNTRNFAATYGFTTINGRNITTGVIKSADGSGVIIDLDHNSITGNIKFLSGGQAVDAEQYINNTVDDEISGLGLDGTNLLAIDQNKWEQGSWNTTTGAHSITDTRIRNTKGGNYIRVEAGTTYTISRHTDVGASKTYHVVLYAYDSSGNYVLADSKIEWQTTFPFTWTPTTATRLEVGIRHSDNSTITAAEAGIAKIKIEKGETATAWTLSPEDVQGGIDAISNMQIGGRNLIGNTGSPTRIPESGTATSQWTYKVFPIYGLPLVLNEPICVNAKVTVNSGTVTSISVLFFNSALSTQYTGFQPTITNGKISFKFNVPSGLAAKTDAKLLIYAGVAGACTGNAITVSEVKLERGTVATDYSPAPEDTAYLQEALAQSQSTDINGGLVLTSMIELRNEQGNVTAGVSGLDDNDVALWAGGTLADAIGNTANVIIGRGGMSKFGRVYIDGQSTTPRLFMVDGLGKRRFLLKSGSLESHTADTVYNSGNSGNTDVFETMSGTYTGTIGTTKSGGNLFPLANMSPNPNNEYTFTIRIKATVQISLYNFVQAGYASVELWYYDGSGYSVAWAATPQLRASYSETYSVDVTKPYSNSGTAQRALQVRYVRDANQGGETGDESATVTLSNVQWCYFGELSDRLMQIAVNGLEYFYNTNNLFKVRYSSGVLTTTIKGNTDIPGVLWAGTITNQAGVTPHYKNSVKYASNQLACDTWNSTNKYFRITHRLGSANFAAMVTPSSSAVTVRTTKDSTYLYVYLSAQASFDLVLFGTN